MTDIKDETVQRPTGSTGEACQHCREDFDNCACKPAQSWLFAAFKRVTGGGA